MTIDSCEGSAERHAYVAVASPDPAKALTVSEELLDSVSSDPAKQEGLRERKGDDYVAVVYWPTGAPRGSPAASSPRCGEEALATRRRDYPLRRAPRPR